MRLLAELGASYIRAGASIGANLVPEAMSKVDYSAVSADRSPFPFALLNGTRDPIIPYKGGEGALWTAPLGLYQYGKRGMHLSCDATADRLVRRWSTVGNIKRTEQSAHNGKVKITSHSTEKGELLVRSIALSDEGHVRCFSTQKMM